MLSTPAHLTGGTETRETRACCAVENVPVERRRERQRRAGHGRDLDALARAVAGRARDLHGRSHGKVVRPERVAGRRGAVGGPPRRVPAATRDRCDEREREPGRTSPDGEDAPSITWRVA